jgi:hypothetical protein
MSDAKIVPGHNATVTIDEVRRLMGGTIRSADDVMAEINMLYRENADLREEVARLKRWRNDAENDLADIKEDIDRILEKR